jgi:hypothetical protein
MDTTPTLAEVARRVDDLVERMEKAIDRLETQYVRFDVFVGFKEGMVDGRAEVDRRIEQLESRQEWLVRTIGGLVLAALLGAVFAAGRVG